MVFVVKASALAWAVRDGGEADADADDLPPDDPLVRAWAVHPMPSLLETLGYLFFFGTFVAGPAFSFNEYRAFVAQTGPFAAVPDPLWPALRRLGLGIACLLAFAALEPISYARAATPAFLEWPLVARLGYLQIAGLAARLKFYGVWKLAEAACVACGLGYTGPDQAAPGGHRWDRLANVNILGIESAQNLKAVLDNWNIHTARWLRHSVFVRLHPSPGNILVPSLVTFLVSAAWHGWYPGYYLTFVTGGLFSYAARIARRKLRPYALASARTKAAYDVATWATTIFATNYLVAPFLVLSATDGLRIWSATYFVGHVGLLAILLVVPLLPSAAHAAQEARSAGSTLSGKATAAGRPAGAVVIEDDSADRNAPPSDPAARKRD
nr:Lysophospholipid acyltransferase 1 [Polyrhizophydium stewartii]